MEKKISAGIALVAFGLGAIAHAGWGSVERVRVNADFDDTQTASIWTKADSVMCPLAVVEMQKKEPGFSLDDCAIEEGAELTVIKGPTGGKDHVELNFAFAVTTTKGAP
jgi:hypothetical protein